MAELDGEKKAELEYYKRVLHKVSHCKSEKNFGWHQQCLQGETVLWLGEEPYDLKDHMLNEHGGTAYFAELDAETKIRSVKISEVYLKITISLMNKKELQF